jgi:hypothetical protein
MGGKGHTVIGAEAAGQANFFQETSTHGLGRMDGGRAQGLAAHKRPAAALGDGEGRAVKAMAGAAMPFKVGGPDVVGGIDPGGGLSRVADTAVGARLGPHGVALEAIAEGGSLREGQARLAPVQAGQKLLATPGGRAPASF